MTGTNGDTQALRDAIEKEAEMNNNQFVTDERESMPEAPTYNFEELTAGFKKLVGQIQKNVSKEDFKSKWAPKITEITDKYLGIGKKVNDCTAAQSEQLTLILDDLTELVGQGL